MLRDKKAVNFEVKISDGGIDLFYKEHYPSMELIEKNGEHYVSGFYNQGEEIFISNYFMIYGEALLSIQLERLKILVLVRLESVKKHIESLKS